MLVSMELILRIMELILKLVDTIFGVMSWRAKRKA